MSGLLTIQLCGKEIDRYAKMLVEVLESLNNDQLWSSKGGLPNSIGNITRHLTGNLNYYFGVGILKTDYQRRREMEFSEKNLPKEKVIAELQAAVKVALEAIEAVDDQMADQPYTNPDGDLKESLALHVLRMTTHFSLHVGQADYAKTIILGS